MPNFVSKLIGSEPEKEPTLMDEVQGLFRMSYKNRMICFGVTLAIGAVFGIIACLYVPVLAINPAGFGVFYTLTNICLIASTFFLVGPMKQIKNMMKGTRIIASVVFILSIVLTLYFAIGLESWILALIAIIIQICAFLWYILSYIPFARTLAKKIFKGFAS